MTIFYVSPTGSGNQSGIGLDNAARIGALDTILAKAKPGDSVYLRADQGSYTIASQISLTHGGTAGSPITIKGVDGSGKAMAATFVSDRNAVTNGQYSATGKQGSEVFRLLSGANGLSFENMAFKNVDTAFRFGADVSNVGIAHMSATNVNRFVENYASGTNKTASVSNVKVSDVTITGFAKTAIRFQYDSHDIVIDGVYGDSQHIDGSDFATGVAFMDTAHDIVVKNTKMGGILDTVNGYHNGDGFASERGNYNLTFENTYAWDASDAGYDLKSSSTKLVNAVAEGNTRNFRIWGDATMEGVRSINPVYHGGTNTVAGIWVASGASLSVRGSTLTAAADATAPLLDLAAGARATLFDVLSNRAGANLVKLGKGALLTGSIGQISQITPPKNGSLVGTDLADTLVGGAGNDTIDGRGGADTMTGGRGDDRYYVDNLGDKVVEGVDGGNDTVFASVGSHTLAANVENLTYTGSGDFAGTGNALDNVLTGGEGDDVLDGRGGADRMIGLGGDDTYVVDDAGDVVVEQAGGGFDTVRTTLSAYTLGDNVEALAFTGSGSFKGTGNALDNQITGGAGGDVLDGGDGDDLIDGGRGLDTLTGGAGDDRLIGGAHLDRIDGGSGKDWIVGDYAQIGTGQAAANDVLSGGTGDDTIYGDAVTMTAGNAGRDIISGGDGDDLIFGDADVMTGGVAGADTLSGGAGDDWIYGDWRSGSGAKGGNDRIDGGTGDDHLFGGLGNDTFVFAPGSGNDVIGDFGQVAGDRDVIDLSAFRTSFGRLAITYDGDGAKITTPFNDTITLTGVTHLSAADFRF